MFSFAVGLSLPAVAISGIAAEAGRRYDLGDVLRSGGYVLVILGSLIVSYEIYTIATLLI
jgi:hypothetical protein